MKSRRFSSTLLLSLVAATLVSGLLLTYTRHEHRAQFRAMQALIAERDRLEVEWGALQLESAAWTGFGRIDREARERLAMRQPDKSNIVFVRVSSADAPSTLSRKESR